VQVIKGIVISLNNVLAEKISYLFQGFPEQVRPIFLQKGKVAHLVVGDMVM